MINLEVIDQNMAVVTELPQQPPLNQFNQITEELIRFGFTGKVLFDLLISKGVSNRFVVAEFDGKNILRNTLRISSTSDIPSKIMTRQINFFASNPNLLRASMLTKSEIDTFLNAKR